MAPKYNLRVEGKSTLVYKHMDFSPAPGQQLMAHQRLANQLQADAVYRKRACVGCLKGIGEQVAGREFGRGTTTHQEVFSCMVRSGSEKADTGEACVRCKGLGNRCEEFPNFLGDKVEAFVKLMPDFNAAVQVPVSQRTDAEQTTIERGIARAQKLSSDLTRTLKAMRDKGKSIDKAGNPVPSPSKKVAVDLLPPGAQAATDTDVAAIKRTVGYLADQAEWATRELKATAQAVRQVSAQQEQLVQAFNTNVQLWNEAAQGDEDSSEVISGLQLVAAETGVIDESDEDMVADDEDSDGQRTPKRPRNV